MERWTSPCSSTRPTLTLTLTLSLTLYLPGGRLPAQAQGGPLLLRGTPLPLLCGGGALPLALPLVLPLAFALPLAFCEALLSRFSVEVGRRVSELELQQQQLVDELQAREDERNAPPPVIPHPHPTPKGCGVLRTSYYSTGDTLPAPSPSPDPGLNPNPNPNPNLNPDNNPNS